MSGPNLRELLDDAPPSQWSETDTDVLPFHEPSDDALDEIVSFGPSVEIERTVERSRWRRNRRRFR